MGNALDFGYYKYTCDDASEVNLRIQAAIGGHADCGFAAYDATKRVMPVNKKKIFRARYALLLDPLTGNRRRIPIGSLTCDIWTRVTTTVSLLVKGSATPVVYNVTHLGGEAIDVAHDVFSL